MKNRAMYHREDSQNAIEEMDQLLDHIMSFEEDLNKSKNLTDPSIAQEFTMLKEYLKYRLRDINKASIAEFHTITRTGNAAK